MNHTHDNSACPEQDIKLLLSPLLVFNPDLGSFIRVEVFHFLKLATMNFSNAKFYEMPSNIFNKLSNEERKALDAMFDKNALSLVEYILQGLAKHQSTSFFHPHPNNPQFNYAVQDLIQKYRNQIEF